MPHDEREPATTTLDDLRTLQADAHRYFKKASRTIDPTTAYNGGERDAFWKQLPNPLQRSAESLTSRLIQLASIATDSLARSPILTDADRLQLGHSVKIMRAALRLRRYQHWDQEVIHDEGRPLGLQAASQSEDVPLPVAQARLSFDRAAEDAEAVIELCGNLTVVAANRTTERTAHGRVRPGTAFVMIWMDPDTPGLVDVSDTVKRCFHRFDVEARRADDIEHEDVITSRILDEIRTSEFLFADLTGERPSVYYEVGYAHSLGKRVIMYRKKGTRIHFDLAAYNCPEYANLRDLEQLLTKRLQDVTGEKPKAP
jgi:hypothetical protein